jgi:hypothetical protein
LKLELHVSIVLGSLVLHDDWHTASEALRVGPYLTFACLLEEIDAVDSDL